jgi:hypothetical protein
LEQCAREGLPLPKKIQEAPELRPGLDLYYYGFLDLVSCWSSGSNCIPWTAIETYCERYGLDDEQREEMHTFVAALDGVYQAHVKKKGSIGGTPGRGGDKAPGTGPGYRA